MPWIMPSGPHESSASSVAHAQGLFARVFVPVDFTSSSHVALRTAIELKRAFGSVVCVFQLVEDSSVGEFLGGLGARRCVGDLVQDARGRLERFVRNVAPELADDVEVRAYADVEPFDDVKNEARHWGATLVLAATVFDGLFRSPAEKLVHAFDVPVLLIPSTWEKQALDIPPGPPSRPTPGIWPK